MKASRAGEPDHGAQGAVTATTVTVGRLVPSIIAANSCVNGDLSFPKRSCASSNEGVSRCSTGGPRARGPLHYETYRGPNCLSARL
jgi:hypothetical protein